MSATRIAAIFRVSLTAHPPAPALAQKPVEAAGYMLRASEPKGAPQPVTRKGGWIGSTRSVAVGQRRYLREAEVQGLEKRRAQPVRITEPAWTSWRRMRRHRGTEDWRVVSTRFNFLLSPAVNAASGQSCCRFFGARLAPADGRGSVGDDCISRKEKIGRFAGGLRLKVREVTPTSRTPFGGGTRNGLGQGRLHAARALFGSSIPSIGYEWTTESRPI